MSEDKLIQVRKDKHQELNGGVFPLASKDNYHSLHECLIIINNESSGLVGVEATLDPTKLGNPVNVHGRISLLRKSGGITFIKLTDQSASMQMIATKAILTDYDKLKLLDLGDIIEITGQLCMSKTNEPSILINSWNVLTKSHRPPPEKFAGISDQEIKYRQRYLDLMSDEESRDRFKIRSTVLRAIRHFMEERNFMEVETPTLNVINSGANAKPFTTHHNALDMELNLRIAPELHLKRLLVGGYEKVYEIGRNYRNEGISTRHNPEFTMMESYQAYGKFPELINYTKDLLLSIDKYCQEKLTGSTQHSYNNHVKQRTFTLDSFTEISMWEAVKAAAAKAEIVIGRGVSIDKETASYVAADLEITTFSNKRLQAIDVKGMFIGLSNCFTKGDKISVLFDYLVEPFLTEDYRTEDGKYSLPVFITEFPKDICPLARASEKDSFFCDRFELFIEGRELCNAFQELNNPDEQLLRFEEQLDSNNKDAMDLDTDYVQALQYGMPPAIGFGMGIDRLVMLLTNAQSIRDIILFPTLKPVRE